MRPGSRTKVSVPLVLPQNRHPERSASQIDRVPQRLGRGVEGTSAMLISPMLLGAFRPPKSDSRICCDTHLMVTGTSFHEDRDGLALNSVGCNIRRSRDDQLAGYFDPARTPDLGRFDQNLYLSFDPIVDQDGARAGCRLRDQTCPICSFSVSPHRSR